MSTFLSLLFGVSVIFSGICLLIIIVKAVTKKPVKKTAICLGVSFLVMVVSVIAYSTKTSNPGESEPTVTVSEEPEETEPIDSEEFEKLKQAHLDDEKSYPKDDLVTDAALDRFALEFRNVYDCQNIDAIPEAFLNAISYLYVHFDIDTYGHNIGEYSWEAVRNIYMGSYDEAHKNFDNAKTSFEDALKKPLDEYLAGITNEGAEESTSETPTAKEVPMIAQEVIYEQNDVKMTVTGLEETSTSWNVNILIENSGNLNLGFNAHAYGVNGIMTRNNIYDMDCDVAAGKKANVSLEIKKNVLSDIGVFDIRCIDVLFWAYDNDKNFKAFDTGQMEIRTSLYNGEHDTHSGNSIYDDGKISVDFLYNEGSKYVFGITSHIGNPITFDFTELSINDYTDSETDYDLYDEDLLDNCQILVIVKVRDDFKKQNSISDVEKIDWNMAIRHNGDYFAKEKIGPIVFTP